MQFVYQEWDIMREKIVREEKLEKVQTNATISRPAFGMLLQEARIKKRMTTLDVANEVKLSANIISMYENGTEVPNSDTEKLLKQLLNIN